MNKENRHSTLAIEQFMVEQLEFGTKMNINNDSRRATVGDRSTKSITTAIGICWCSGYLGIQNFVHRLFMLLCINKMTAM